MGCDSSRPTDTSSGKKKRKASKKGKVLTYDVYDCLPEHRKGGKRKKGGKKKAPSVSSPEGGKPPTHEGPVRKGATLGTKEPTKAPNDDLGEPEPEPRKVSSFTVQDANTPSGQNPFTTLFPRAGAAGGGDDKKEPNPGGNRVVTSSSGDSFGDTKSSTSEEGERRFSKVSFAADTSSVRPPKTGGKVKVAGKGTHSHSSSTRSTGDSAGLTGSASSSKSPQWIPTQVPKAKCAPHRVRIVRQWIDGSVLLDDSYLEEGPLLDPQHSSAQVKREKEIGDKERKRVTQQQDADDAEIQKAQDFVANWHATYSAPLNPGAMSGAPASNDPPNVIHVNTDSCEPELASCSLSSFSEGKLLLKDKNPAGSGEGAALLLSDVIGRSSSTRSSQRGSASEVVGVGSENLPASLENLLTSSNLAGTSSQVTSEGDVSRREASTSDGGELVSVVI